MKPTLYYLLFRRNNCNEYDVFETHCCQEKGCIMSDEVYLTTCLPGKVREFVEEFEAELIEGIVDGIDVDYIPVKK